VPALGLRFISTLGQEKLALIKLQADFPIGLADY
jgi:hypothetical protein